MHRVKGLEFETVFIAGINDGVMPMESFNRDEEDITVVRENEKAERSLLYVASTRAKKLLYITSNGKVSRFL
jgi:superfamily I DNA/RNA helicase